MPGWKDACQNLLTGSASTIRSRFVPVAKALSRVVPDSNRRMIYEFAMQVGESRSMKNQAIFIFAEHRDEVAADAAFVMASAFACVDEPGLTPLAFKSDIHLPFVV